MLIIAMKSYSAVIYFAPGQFNLNYWIIPVNYGCVEGEKFLRVGFSTFSETNNDYFEIRRSTDTDFENGYTIIGGYIDGCGTCGGRNYEILDYGPFTPGYTYYYQVRATSNFGFEGIPQNFGSSGYISTTPTIVNWVNQVTSSVSISSTPNTENSYTWGIESRNKQGVTISLSPTEVAKVFVEQNNFKFNFALNFSLSMVNIEVNIDGGSYMNINSGPPFSNFIWNNAGNYFTNIGYHLMGVNFTDAVSGTIYHREYKVFVVPKSDELYKDNYCNTIRVWRGIGGGSRIPLLLSEGFDAYNTKSEQYYREAGKDLINCLLTKGFDIYVINYKYNSQDIRNNAAVFSSAIRYVSAINNNQPIIAAGMSMGGIINRYACAKAENDGNPLPISKFLTLDSPHQGAVISSTLQDWRKSITDGDGFAEAASKNDAAYELLNYNAYEPTGVFKTDFFNELNSLNGNGYPHLVPTIGVSFSTIDPNPNPIGALWLYVNVTGVPGNQNQYFQITQEESVSGSFLPSLNMDPTAVGVNIDGEPLISKAYFSSNLLAFLRPFEDQTATIIQYASPSFIPHNSSLDIVNGVSKFNITIQPTTTGFHDIIPPDIIEPLINVLINRNLYLQNKTITDTKNYIANFTIEAGNNVISTLPAGDFIVANGSNVMMTAGNQIKLSPGVRVLAGSNFNTKIDLVRCDGVQSTQFRNSISNDNNDDYIDNQENNPSPLYSGNKISETIVAEETILKTQVNSINIIPNPSNGKFKISITKNEKSIGIKELKVYDLMGKVIWQTASSTNSVFDADIADVAPGIYYVRSVNDEGDIEVQKLIKQ